jgi:hypothetical protein
MAHSRLDLFHLFPDSVTIPGLIGTFDHRNLWVDGVLTRLIRTAMPLPPELQRWLVCDGCLGNRWADLVAAIIANRWSLRSVERVLARLSGMAGLVFF